MKKLQAQVEKARNSYRPDKIKYLLIAEAPPDCVDRFFYYNAVFKHDDLFLGISQALYPALKNNHLIQRRKKDDTIKQRILKLLQNDGFYLIDLSDVPLSFLKSDLTSQVPALINKINSLVNENTKIIIIKSSVYEIIFQPLINAGIKNIINCRIPFPGSGGQKKFQLAFAKALILANYR